MQMKKGTARRWHSERFDVCRSYCCVWDFPGLTTQQALFGVLRRHDALCRDLTTSDPQRGCDAAMRVGRWRCKVLHAPPFGRYSANCPSITASAAIQFIFYFFVDSLSRAFFDPHLSTCSSPLRHLAHRAPTAPLKQYTCLIPPRRQLTRQRRLVIASFLLVSFPRFRVAHAPFRSSRARVANPQTGRRASRHRPLLGSPPKSKSSPA